MEAELRMISTRTKKNCAMENTTKIALQATAPPFPFTIPLGTGCRGRHSTTPTVVTH